MFWVTVVPNPKKSPTAFVKIDERGIQSSPYFPKFLPTEILPVPVTEPVKLY
jgi:hypothetical protein